jgi:hypothetical protein
MIAIVVSVAIAVHAQNQGQTTGISTGSTPYVLPLLAGTDTISIFTVDNTGINADDSVGGYGMAGVPDGMGAYDNGDGTFTLLLNHEIPSGLGVARAHGGVGAFVSEWIISKNTLGVLAGSDLIKTVFGWNVATQASDTSPLVNAVFFRFCSADLPARTAFYNSATGLGSQERIFMDGEEDSTHGWALAHVATGASKGKTYILGKFNLTTNGSGRTGVGNWETLVANPFEQDKTIVIGNSDGGTGLQNNALAVYVGTKLSSGTEADKAGLTNGTLKFVRVDNNAVEIVNNTTRATNITSGTRFSLSDSSSTTFSRPEDGAWNPNNPREFYFVTTDQLDNLSDGLGNQIGMTRLWRLTFDNLANPDAGGKIDLLIDGRTVDGLKANMFDNIAVNRQSGRLLLQEDVGGAPHNGKMWEYDPVSDALTMITRHDPARFGDRAGGFTTPATFPFNNDEETSGVIDITDIMAGSALATGNPGEAWYISSDQAHYTPAGGTGITPAQVEGGQIFVIHETGTQTARSGFVRDRRTGQFSQQVTYFNGTGAPATGPLYVVLDNLSPNATLANATGNVGASPYLPIPGTDPRLAAGATAVATLQFNNPTNGPITYSYRVVSGVPH